MDKNLHAEVEIVNLIQEGYELLMDRAGQVPACQSWLQAWARVKTLTGPEMRTCRDFTLACPRLETDFKNWCYDFMFELHNAGIDDAKYFEHRLSFIREFMAQFPDENEDIQLNFGRGAAEALWQLGRQVESDTAYAALVERLPDQGWAYIGWADEYWIMKNSAKAYARAETIMKRALDRPKIQDRVDVLERLAELYDEWGKPEAHQQTLAQLETARAKFKPRFSVSLPTLKRPALPKKKTAKRTKRGRRGKKG
jgi:hypothetical protein